MRLITDSVEFLIRCPCGVRIAYGLFEANNQLIQCPKCLLKHTASNDKTIISYDECQMHYSSLYEPLLASPE